MKKAVVLIAVLLVSAIGFTACSVPNIGEMEVVNASEDSQVETSTPPINDSSKENTGEQVTEETPPPDDNQTTEPPKEALVPDSNQQKTEDVSISAGELQQYTDLISCKTTVISNNNMIVQVKNNNAVVIPMLTVNVHYPNETKSYNFHQVPSNGNIAIPVEKESGDLPPAVSADITVSMKDNQYTDVSSALEVSESHTDTSYTLTIVNTSDRACQKLNITALFSDNSGVFCAQNMKASETVLSGGTTSITFTLPQKMIDEEVAFTSVSYVINEAVG